MAFPIDLATWFSSGLWGEQGKISATLTQAGHSWLELVGWQFLTQDHSGHPPKELPARPPSNAYNFGRSVNSGGLVPHTRFTFILLSDVQVDTRCKNLLFSNKTCKYGTITRPEDWLNLAAREQWLPNDLFH